MLIYISCAALQTLCSAPSPLLLSDTHPLPPSAINTLTQTHSTDCCFSSLFKQSQQVLAPQGEGSSTIMGLFLISLLNIVIPLMAILSPINAEWPPSPGYWPSSRFRSMSFYQGFRNLWGPQHERVDQDALTIWLDRTSGALVIR